MAVDVRAWAKRNLSRVEPALQHNGFAYTFALVYALTNVLVFMIGGSPEWRNLAEEGRHVRVFGTAARGSGALLNFNSAIVILVAARTLMTYLRRTVLNMIVPFDKAMPAFHSWVANVLVVAGVLHVGAHIVNYIDMRKWAPGFYGDASLAMTGSLLVLVLGAMRVTSLPRIRKKSFELFYWVHSGGFVLFFILLILHGSHHQQLRTWSYILGPLLIYILDRLVRLLREKGSQLLVTRDSAVLKGSDMVCLRIPRTFSYLAGQYCDIKVPLVSKYEWHPFTIASSPHESEMLFYIKVSGDWTQKLYTLFKERGGEHDDIMIHIRGPYGAPAQHVGQYEHVVLISGGVGATPFASITKYAHNWILSYTQRGAQVSNTVSAAYTRNQSARGTPSVPGTPTMGMAGALPTSSNARSRDASRPRSRNLSRNISRNFSRPMSRSASRNGSTPVSRSGSAGNLERMGSTRTTDSIGIIIQEQRLNQPNGPSQVLEDRGSTGDQGGAAKPGNSSDGLSLNLDLTMAGVRPDGRIASSANASMRRFLDDQPPPPSPLPDDYDPELGDPDAPIPVRRPNQSRPETPVNMGGGSSGSFNTRDPVLPTSGMFDDEEVPVTEEVAIGVPIASSEALRGLRKHGRFVAKDDTSGPMLEVGLGDVDIDPEAGGLELEESILREQQTASNAYMMMGMSFGSEAMMRHLQAQDKNKMRSSMVRASMNLMDDALDAAVWQDRALFYLHTVTVNWILLWVMIVRFTLVAMGQIVGHFSMEQNGLNIYNSVAFNVIDLLLGVLVAVPVIGAMLLEVSMHGIGNFFADTPGNSFDVAILVPLIFTCFLLSVLGFAEVGYRSEHVSKITVFVLFPTLSMFLLWRIGRTIGSRITLAQYFKSTHSQTKSLDFIWVSKHAEEDWWLVDELLPLAQTNIVRLHRFITRQAEKAEPWMMNYEKLPFKTTYSRPNWDEVFGNLVERSRSGSVIGVFFCGPDPMCRGVQQAAMKAMAKSVQNAYLRGYMLNRRNGGRAQPEEELGFTASRTGSNDSPGVFQRVGSKVGHFARNMSWSKKQRGPLPPMESNDAAAYGCNVRISVRNENFN